MDPCGRSVKLVSTTLRGGVLRVLAGFTYLPNKRLMFVLCLVAAISTTHRDQKNKYALHGTARHGTVRHTVASIVVFTEPSAPFAHRSPMASSGSNMQPLLGRFMVCASHVHAAYCVACGRGPNSRYATCAESRCGTSLSIG